MTKDLAAQQQQAVALRDYMQGDKIKGQLAAALPKWLSADRLLRIVFTSFIKNPKLLDCTRESILSAVMQCAQLGLEPILGRAYLIPYDNRKNVGGNWMKVSECQMQIGYQGLVDLARRTDTIADVWGANVYENDEFSVQYGMNRNLYHVPWFMDPDKRNAGESGEVIGAYVVWKLKDETMHPEFMSIIDIHKRRERSQSYAWAETGDPKRGGGKQNSVWHEWPEEMNLKTVIKHSSKLIPASIEFMQAIEIDNAAESGFSTSGFFDDQITLPDPVIPKQLAPDETPPQGAAGSKTQDDSDQVKAKFDALFGKPEDDPQLKGFLAGTAKMNNKMVSEIMESAIANSEIFKRAFKQWKTKGATTTDKGQTTKPDPGQAHAQAGGSGGEVDEAATAFIKKWIRLHAPSFEKFVKLNIGEFDKQPDWVIKRAKKKWVNFGWDVEQWPSKTVTDNDNAQSAGQTTSGEGKDSGEGVSVQPDANQAVEITQTDEWQEISMLQERYPDIYSMLARGRALKTVDDLTELIRDINNSVIDAEGDLSSQHAFMQTQAPGDGDIPH